MFDYFLQLYGFYSRFSGSKRECSRIFRNRLMSHRDQLSREEYLRLSLMLSLLERDLESISPAEWAQDVERLVRELTLGEKPCDCGKGGCR